MRLNTADALLLWSQKQKGDEGCCGFFPCVDLAEKNPLAGSGCNDKTGVGAYQERYLTKGDWFKKIWVGMLSPLVMWDVLSMSSTASGLRLALNERYFV